MPIPKKPSRYTSAIQTKDKPALEFISRSDDGASAVPKKPEPEAKPMMIRGITQSLRRRINEEAKRRSVTASAAIRMVLLDHLPPDPGPENDE